MTNGIWTSCENLRTPMPAKPSYDLPDALLMAESRLLVAERRLGVANRSLADLSNQASDVDRYQHWYQHQQFAAMAVETANGEVARQVADKRRLGSAALGVDPTATSQSVDYDNQ